MLEGCSYKAQYRGWLLGVEAMFGHVQQPLSVCLAAAVHNKLCAAVHSPPRRQMANIEFANAQTLRLLSMKHWDLVSAEDRGVWPAHRGTHSNPAVELSLTTQQLHGHWPLCMSTYMTSMSPRMCWQHTCTDRACKWRCIPVCLPVCQVTAPVTAG